MQQEKSGFSIAALVLGIIALSMAITCCMTILCFIPAIAGIICAMIAKSRSERWEGTAIGGFVCSIIALVIFIVFMVFAVVISHSSYNDLDTFIEDYDNGDTPSDSIPGLDDNDDSKDNVF